MTLATVCGVTGVRRDCAPELSGAGATCTAWVRAFWRSRRGSCYWQLASCVEARACFDVHARRRDGTRLYRGIVRVLELVLTVSYVLSLP